MWPGLRSWPSASIRSSLRILLMAREVVLCAAHLGAASHVLVAVWIPQTVVDHDVDHLLIAHPVTGACLRQRVWRVRHRLHAAGDRDVVFPAADVIRCIHHR